MLQIHTNGRFTGPVVILALVLLAAGTPAQSNKAEKSASSKPVVEITTLPHAGGGPTEQELIAGRVNIANPSNYHICIFSHTDRWYVQPYVAAPLTEINPSDGRWQTRIHLGEEYAVMLVKPAYNPPATLLELPKTGGDIVYIAREAARR
jgi:hypothetical protein